MKKFLSSLFSNPKSLLCVGSAIFAGIILGAVTVKLADTEYLFAAERDIYSFFSAGHITSSSDIYALFLKSLLKNVAFCFLTFISSFCIIGIPVLIILPAFKSYCLSVLFFVYDFMNIPVTAGKFLLIFLPHNLIFLLAYFFLTSESVKMNRILLNALRQDGERGLSHSATSGYCFSFIFLTVFIVLSSLVEVLMIYFFY